MLPGLQAGDPITVAQQDDVPPQDSADVRHDLRLPHRGVHHHLQHLQRPQKRRLGPCRQKTIRQHDQPIIDCHEVRPNAPDVFLEVRVLERLLALLRGLELSGRSVQVQTRSIHSNQTYPNVLS